MSKTEEEELFRDLIYRFFKLRLSQKRDIMHRMQIELDPAASKPDFARFRDALLKVEPNRLRELAELVREHENATH